ncbi:MAG: lipopolysaccharide heptosyltransferase family protein [Deltaproteobacteria bacterium]|nr:MAG: lipopolysaccharide heptosyltransferase family protein [Deltaproteobacteria bacterium]
MNSLLIVNLKRFGDVYTTAHLVQSIKSQNPHCKIGMVVFSEFEQAAKNINDIDEVYTLSRKRISSLLKNKIFNNAKALEEVHDFAQRITRGNWTELFNMSNDFFGTYFCSYLKEREPRLAIYGTTVNRNKTVNFSNEFATIFNDVITNRENSPLHFQDCYHSILGVSRTESSAKLNLSPRYDELAKTQIEQLKKTAGENSRVIAIQLKTSDVNKELPYLTMRNLIAFLKEDQTIVPLILFAPIQEERELAASINKEFGNSLITVEADLAAVGSVLNNVDLLVTPDTVVKHIADLAGTRVLEISLGPSPFLKQGPVTTGSAIITDRISDRNFKVSHYKTNIIKTRIKAKDVYEAVKFMINDGYIPSMDKGLSLYVSQQDSMGTRYDIVAGDVPWNKEIDRIASRYYIGETTRRFKLEEIKSSITNFPTEARKNWSNGQKERAAAILKDLLSTLRMLAKMKNNTNAAGEFIGSLDKLLNHCAGDDLMALPVLFFRARVENIQATDRKDSMNQTEKLLYELKSHIQKAYDVCKTVEADKATVVNTNNTVTNGYTL